MQTDTHRALSVVRSLADGVDPATGEEYPADSPYQQPQIIRALFAATQALELEAQRRRRQTGLPDNSGKPWTADEDRRLLDGFAGKKTPTQLAEDHERTLGAIRARLIKHGKISP